MSECISHTTMHACHTSPLPPLHPEPIPLTQVAHVSPRSRKSPSHAVCVQNSRLRPSRSCPGGPHRPTTRLQTGRMDLPPRPLDGLNAVSPLGRCGARSLTLHTGWFTRLGMCITVCRSGGWSGLDRHDGLQHVSKPVSADSRNHPFRQHQHQH